MSIYEELKAAGVPLDHHESDLYVPLNDTTRPIIQRYKFKEQVRFIKKDDNGVQWVEVPFAYDPHFDEAAV